MSRGCMRLSAAKWPRNLVYAQNTHTHLNWQYAFVSFDFNTYRNNNCYSYRIQGHTHTQTHTENTERFKDLEEGSIIRVFFIIITVQFITGFNRRTAATGLAEWGSWRESENERERGRTRERKDSTWRESDRERVVVKRQEEIGLLNRLSDVKQIH